RCRRRPGVRAAPSPDHSMSGPVQVLVVGFEQPSFSGEVVAELGRLGSAGIVRLVDVLLVRRDDDGTFETLDPPQGFDPELGRVATTILGEGVEGADDGDGWSLADIVDPGSIAAVALI